MTDDLRRALDALDVMIDRQTLTGAVMVREAVRAALAARPEPFRPDYDWTSTCPHEGDEVCPGGDDGCRCECHAVDARPEPRAEGLRHELVQMSIDMVNGHYTDAHARLEAILAATPPAEGLDVGRLARALEADGWTVNVEDTAERVAREYAALARKQPEADR